MDSKNRDIERAYSFLPKLEIKLLIIPKITMTTTKIEIIDSLLITEPPLVLYIIYTTNVTIIFT